MLDYAFDVVFLIDMYLRAVVMAFNDIQGGKDVLVIERPAIFSHYIRSLRFKVDLLASLPLSVVGFAIGYYPQLLRISHLLRMFNMSTYLKEFSDYCEEGLNLVLSARARAAHAFPRVSALRCFPRAPAPRMFPPVSARNSGWSAVSAPYQRRMPMLNVRVDAHICVRGRARASRDTQCACVRGGRRRG